jgi:hypothetical protein
LIRFLKIKGKGKGELIMAAIEAQVASGAGAVMLQTQM